MHEFQTRTFKAGDTVAYEINTWLMDPAPGRNRSAINVEGYVVCDGMIVITISFMDWGKL